MSVIEIYSRKKDKERYAELTRRINPVAEKHICSGEVSKGFIEDCIEGADYLLCHFFRDTIRGFAFLSLHHNPKYLYIDLICNAKSHTMTRRSTTGVPKFSGKNLIEAIIAFGKTLKVKEVRLSAIDNVILYYYKLNFRFKNERRTDTALLEELKTAQQSKNEERIEKAMNKIVGKYYPGFYNERRQRSLGDKKQENAMDAGIPMIYTYKTRSVCQGKSVKNPNKCRKYSECKVAQGTQRAFCRAKKNVTLRQN
jgi:hypothetical protein